MKRRAFVHRLETLGCMLKRSGAKHDIYFNPRNGLSTTVPRHQELADTLCKTILKQLGLKNRQP
ncbi:MAG: type II toxin-antitoxin system HicA family toxin [Nitrospira sp.]|nr:type II toxin-antitoxin system HicA family toxin [Nitrospira sp.]